MISGTIAFIQRLYLPAWVRRTFKTIGEFPLFCTVFDFTLPAMFRLSQITLMTACTWPLMVTVFVTHHAVHSTWCKHSSLCFFRHFHILSLLYRKGMNTYFKYLSMPLLTSSYSLIHQYPITINMPTVCHVSNSFNADSETCL